MLGGNVDSIYIYTKWSRCFLNSEWINPTDSQNLYPPQLGLHWRLNKQRCNSSNMMEYVSVCIGQLFLFLAMNMIFNLWLASSVPVGLCSGLFFCCCPSSLSGRFSTKSWPNSLCVLVPFGTLFLSYLWRWIWQFHIYTLGTAGRVLTKGANFTTWLMTPECFTFLI